jgi:hypothetical protein
MQNSPDLNKKLSKLDRDFIEDYIVVNFLDVDRYLRRLEELTPLTEIQARDIIHKLRGLFNKQADLWLRGFDSEYLQPPNLGPKTEKEDAA